MSRHYRGIVSLLFTICCVSVCWPVSPITSITAQIDAGVSPQTITLQSITVNGYTISSNDLVTGTSTGVATAQPAPYNQIVNADSFDLNLFAGRTTENPPEIQTTLFGGKDKWKDSNGIGVDFFIFETNGNDDFTVQAILPDGIFGQPVSVSMSNWGLTGYSITAPFHTGQVIAGIAISITDLKDDAGNFLTTSSIIAGLQIASVGLDPCLIAAVKYDGTIVSGPAKYADINGDLLVNIEDLLALAQQWLDGAGCAEYPLACADLIGQDGVNMYDLGILSSDWKTSRPSVFELSELMADNSTVKSTVLYSGGLAEYPDWIEIHNLDAQAAKTLSGWYLTDDRDNLNKWRFPPGLSIPAGGYLLVFASGRSDTEYPFVDMQGYYHTNFTLDSSGEYLALVGADGETIMHEYIGYEFDSGRFGYPPQVENYSFGVSGQDTVYFSIPTPGSANSTALAGFVADTQFAPRRGFYDTAQTVTLSCATPGATIKYTLDGSTPSESAGLIYSDPIPISKTKTLRAMAFKPGWQSTNVDTHTYIFLSQVLAQTDADAPGYPKPYSDAGNGKKAYHDYNMDAAVVNNPSYSGMILNAMKDIPTLSIAANPADMNMTANGGFYWGELEKPCSVELIYSDDSDKNVQADCGIEPHSHNRIKRSMKISFKTEYGDDKLTTSLLQDIPLNGDTADKTLDRIVLRAGNNRSWSRAWNPGRTSFTEDEWYRQSQVDMSGFGSRGAFVHLYINGLYWGMYNPVERPDAWFCASYFGGEPVDWYAVNHGGTVSGNPTRWNYLQGTLKNKDMSDPNNYAEMQQYLDIVSFSDYLMLAWSMGLDDWPTNNWWAGNCNNPAGPVRFFCWDGEWSWRTTRGTLNGRVHPSFISSITSSTNQIAGLWHSVRKNNNYMMFFADRVYHHFFNDGVMTDDNCKARFNALNTHVYDAVVPESARWGDTCKDFTALTPYNATRTRDVDWVFTTNEMLGLMTGNAAKFITSLRAQGYYPNIDPPAFNINGTPQHGGYVPAGAALTFSGANEIWYTLNGQDPRLAGGTVNSTATLYAGQTISLNQTTLVKARTKNGAVWSALHEATYSLANVAAGLRITELMYHPAPTGVSFVELTNIGPSSIHLLGVRFTRGIDYTFGDMTLAPGEYMIVTNDAAAFSSAYPEVSSSIVYSPYIGQLANEGETIRLQDAAGAAIQEFEYKDSWYDLTDGKGFSLTAVNPAATQPQEWSLETAWRPSSVIGGTPGAADNGQVPLPGSIIFNEILSHAHDTAPDWLELYNTTDTPIPIGGWFLSDNINNLQKYQIPANLFVPALGYLVLYQDQHFGSALAFSENGETAYLTSASDGQLTGYQAEQSFGASETNTAFGRYVKSTGEMDFVAQSVNTPGADNAYPKVGPLIISEIMYNPNTNADAEYVEITNISGQAIPLWSYDSMTQQNVSWRFKDEDGIMYDFPPQTSIAANEKILLVKNLAVFQSVFTTIPAGTKIFAWGSGSLSNGGEKIDILMPGDTDNGTKYYIRIDKVNYDDIAPWPIEPDGTGTALGRVNSALYGNDPNNWESVLPSPGQ